MRSEILDLRFFYSLITFRYSLIRMAVTLSLSNCFSNHELNNKRNTLRINV